MPESPQDRELGGVTVEQFTITSVPGGTVARAAVLLTVIVEYRPLVAGGLPAGRFVAVVRRSVHDLRSRRVLGTNEEVGLGLAEVRWRSGGLDPLPAGVDARYIRTHAALSGLSIMLPALWPGTYEVTCEIYRATVTETGVGEWRLGKRIGGPFSTQLTVDAGAARTPTGPQRFGNALAGQDSILRVIVPDPAAAMLPIGGGQSMTFTWSPTGYPILLLALHPQAAALVNLPAGPIAAALLPIVRSIEAFVHEVSPTELSRTLFSPIYRLAPGGRTAHDPTGSLVNDLGRQNSDKLTAVSDGTQRSADKTTNADQRQYGFGQAVVTAVDALAWDPNNVAAYLAAARAHVMRAQAVDSEAAATLALRSAFDLFLTLVFRLRVLDRMLGELDANDPALRPHRERAVACLRGRISPTYWTAFREVAALLDLDTALDLRFPRVS